MKALFRGHDEVCVCVRVRTDLLPSVDDVLGVRQSVDAGSPDDRVVPRGGVGHLHRTELKKRLPQRHSAEQHRPERGERTP